MSKKISFVGAGNMGSAILRGLLGSGYSTKDISFFEPYDATAQTVAALGPKRIPDFETLAKDADVLFLCVKPQIFKTASVEWKLALDKISNSPVIISIMAGVSRKTLIEALGAQFSIIRVMPNLPLTVGKGTVAIATDSIPEENLALAESLFAPVGTTVRVQESLMDAVTGLSGSAPAYVFEFIEGLVRGGVRMGLSRTVAMQLTLATIEGSVEMVKKTNHGPGELCAMVCSPAGTTIAGIQALEDGGFKGTLMHAVEAATKRSKELG